MIEDKKGGVIIMATNNIIVPQKSDKLTRMKYEIASEMGFPDYENMDRGNLTARQNGSIGGEITKRLVKKAMENL